MTDDTTTISTGTVEHSIRRFLGIPYAAAPQLPYPGAIGELLSSVRIDGDDILTANVWSPTDAADAPVVLWIHGGAFERGTAALPTYDGTAFARCGIVFVSINARLGSEGFSVLDDAPLNLGLRDTAAALKWVHQEIAAFGGSPTNITLMGESAGGSLVAALLAREDTRSLVSRAIIQSAPLEAQSAGKAGRVTAQLAKRVGATRTRDSFATLAPEDLLRVRREQSAGSSPLGGAPGFQLAIDPESLPRSPHEVLAEIDTPVLIGTNTDEYRLWFPPQALADIRPAKLFLARLALRIPGRAMRACRADWPDASTGELFGQLATDFLLRAPATRRARARPDATYMYEFAWQSPVRDLRAAHAMELGFVFDRPDDPDSVRMAGAAPPRTLGVDTSRSWASFITTGDPGWEPYGPDRRTRLFDTRTTTMPQRRTGGLDLLR